MSQYSKEKIMKKIHRAKVENYCPSLELEVKFYPKNFGRSTSLIEWNSGQKSLASTVEFEESVWFDLKIRLGNIFND